MPLPAPTALRKARGLRPETLRPDTLTGRLLVAAAGASVAAVGATALEVKRRMTAGQTAFIPDVELIRGVFARMTTPLLPDDYLHMINPLWSARELRGRIVKVVPETDDAATLVIKPGWGWSFDYQAGQYVGIGVSVHGKWHWRSYSLSSPASENGEITITVKAMPEGFMSSHLVKGLEPGTIVRLALPQGEFVLPDPPPPKILFWTGGSGITPVMSMLRTFDRRGTMPDVIHVHAAPSKNAAIFRDELHRLAEKHDCYTLIEAFDDTDGRLDVDALVKKVPDWQDRQAWVCGPGPMLDAAEKKWDKARIGKQLHLERFSADLSDEAEGGVVTFAVSDKKAEIDGATTLLEAGEAQGIQMPFGCRMGICHSCVVPLKKGRVKDLRNGSTYEENQGIQTCITAAAGDCVIEI